MIIGNEIYSGIIGVFKRWEKEGYTRPVIIVYLSKMCSNVPFYQENVRKLTKLERALQ